MTDLIRGKVAKVLNSREVALNVGREQGVRTDMQFDILDPTTHDIVDPDSEEVIGTVNRPKVRVRIGIVDNKFSIAQTFRTRSVNVGGVGLSAAIKALEPPRWVTKSETLKTSESTWEDLDEWQSFVKTGDPVVQVPKTMESV